MIDCPPDDALGLQAMTESGVYQPWLLVVDDDLDDQNLARRAFVTLERPQNLRVANDGEEALKVLRSEPSPMLVLLDLKLPRISGVEVLIAMRDDTRLRTVPVVVLTSSKELSDIGACYDLGCNAYVEKPIDFDEFMHVLASTLDFWLGVNLTLPAPIIA